MGCINSVHRGSRGNEYIETLTLKRKVTKKTDTTDKKNLKISFSVIADPMSSIEDIDTSHELHEYKLQTQSSFCHRHNGCHRRSFHTLSYLEGQRYTKFPNLVGYRLCTDCNEHGSDVLKTMAPKGDNNRDMCRKCSLKKRHRSSLKLYNFNLESNQKDKTLSQMNMATFASFLALTALDLTAPASDVILKNRKNTWIQLAGHPGGFAPAGPNTIWKKRYTKDNYEMQAYEELMEDLACKIVPMFYREVEYNAEYFIEIEDLLQHFTDPSIMDIKMGTRTFLETEVINTTQRKDLYDKMVALDPNAPTPEERVSQSITKLRYMQFREQESSTAEYGFRIEALRSTGQAPCTNLKRVRTKEQIQDVLCKFIQHNSSIQASLLQGLENIRRTIEQSPFFMSHEIIGSSLLLMFDKEQKCGTWVIDFSKTIPVEDGIVLNHRSPWQLGNHEDGFLSGLDNVIQFLTDLEVKPQILDSKCSSSQSSSDAS